MFIEEAPFFSLKEGAVLHNKNSTLLDASHALSIHMHPAPNLSKIAGNFTKFNSTLQQKCSFVSTETLCLCADNSAFWPGNNLEIKWVLVFLNFYI